MKLVARAFIWTCMCLPLGILCLYYLNTHQALIRATEDSKDQANRPKTGPRKLTEEPKKEISLSTIEQAGDTSTQNVTDTESTKAVDMSDKDKLLLKYPPFQPVEEVEFPTTENSEPRIQHIIHQILCTEHVPEPYKELINTFINQNPKWQYRFWTYKSGRQLLVDRHPYLVPMFDHLEECEDKQLDMIKYAAVYEFGGVYAQLDMENLRPLDRATLKYACIISVEPIEHTAKLFHGKGNGKQPPKLNVDTLLCRAKHPFLKRLLTYLKIFVPFGFRDETTGGDFVTGHFMMYNGIDSQSINKRVSNQTSNSPYFYKGNRTEDGNDTVYIPNSQYFCDTIDPKFLDNNGNLEICSKFVQITHMKRGALVTYMTPGDRQACAEFERRRKIRENKKYTFIVHHWHDSTFYDYERWLKAQKKIHIKEIVPGCIFYT